MLDRWEGQRAAERPRLAIAGGPYLEALEPGGRERFEHGCGRLEAAGWERRTIAVMPDFDDIVARHRRLVAGEAAEVHRDWYPRYGEEYHPKTRELIEGGLTLEDGAVEKARRGRQQLRRALELEMDHSEVDVWVTPASQDVAPLGLDSTGDPILNLPWSHAGLPSVTLPAPVADGLPFGLQFVGRFGADEALLAAADRWEEALAA